MGHISLVDKIIDELDRIFNEMRSRPKVRFGQRDECKECGRPKEEFCNSDYLEYLGRWNPCLVTDLLGYAEPVYGRIYLCLNNIIETHRYMDDVKIDSILRLVFYHELCHLAIGDIDMRVIPREERFDEPYCEYVALKALNGGFEANGVSYRFKPLGERVVRALSRVRRPVPYRYFDKYFIRELLDLDPFELVKGFLGYYGLRPGKPVDLKEVVLCRGVGLK